MAFNSNPAGRALEFCSTELVFLAVYIAAVLLIPRPALSARLASIAVLCGVTFALQVTFFQWCSNPHWRSFTASSFPVQLLSASEIILREYPPLPANTSFASRVVATASLFWNMRRIGTKWQTPNVKTTNLTRAQFLRRRLATTFIAYIVFDAFVSAPPPNPSMITSEKQSLLLKNLSAEDIVFRIIGSVSYWFGGFLCIFIVSNLVAIIFVATGISSPNDRPPLFGSVKDAYTLRNFWAVLWHECLRSSLTFHADAFVDKILRIPRGTLLSRYTRLFAVFLISGIIHFNCEHGMGVPSKEGGGLVFFPVQAMGIMLEDGVQWLAGKKFQQWGVRRFVGYIWVLAFFAWATPSWSYPQMRVGNDPSAFLPVRVIGPLLGLLR